MARIDLEDVGHRYSGAADAWALRPMTMTWNDGGAYALLGPSGCGKTTLLNIISGLIAPTRGKVSFDGRDVTALAPEARNIAQVFQFPVVYDTMTVFDNLAFPLRNRGWSAAQLRQRVEEVADILELRADLSRRARALSADQKQKISLGRGLVRPDVAAVLFDEPLTVIDPHLKWLLRRKLKQIHQQLKLSLLYVTHDQTEALTFADQVVVMSQGEIVQIGTPEQLFETPAHRFVGHFIGSPGMNFLACEWRAGAATVADVRVETSSTQAPSGGEPLAIGVRPEYLELASTPGPNRVPVRVAAIQDQGVHTMVRLEVGASFAWAKLRTTTATPATGNAFACLPPTRCALYAGERRVP
ncbi:MAG TPA: ABC transporter ATP-binding protein [Steroidobacteraceae bacterium]|nr:ABC transporter ATP-binding protein [Steroidobacteraceae bacterium]